MSDAEVWVRTLDPKRKTGNPQPQKTLQKSRPKRSDKSSNVRKSDTNRPISIFHQQVATIWHGSAFASLCTSMDYVDIIKNEFLRRKFERPNYSLRTFAADLDLKPSHLCRILKGQRGLSLQNAISVAARLGLKGNAIHAFKFLVLSKHSRAKSWRRIARLALQKAHIKKARIELLGFNSLGTEYYISKHRMWQAQAFHAQLLKAAGDLRRKKTSVVSYDK